jgi:hypothetical protein
VTSIFIRDNPILSSERMLHKDYNWEVFSWKIEILVVSLKGLVAKTNRLAVNRRLQSNSDYDVDFATV